MTTTIFAGTQSAQGMSITTNNGDELYFEQNSTAANAAVTNNAGGTTTFSDAATGGSAQIDNNGGTTFFNNASTADHSTVTAEANGNVYFEGSSTAGYATITSSGTGTTNLEENSSAGNATVSSVDGGATYFRGTATADHSTLLTRNNGFLDFSQTATAANASLTNADGGTTYFEDGSSGGNVTILDTAGATYFSNTSTAANANVSNTGTGFLDFADTSTAGNATILNDGSAIPSGSTGSYTDFEGNSTAGSSTITSINGGRVVFYDHSDGGNARLVTQGASSVEFSLTSGLAGDHKVGIGSISGSGTIYLGANALTVGSLGLNDTVSGQILAGGRGGGTGASLVKVGSGTLTLSGNNTYSGGTTLVGGTLDLAAASAAGSGALTFTSGAQSLDIEAAALGSDAQHSFGNTIAGFATDGDTIDVRGIGLATASFNALTDVLTLTAGGQTAATLALSGNFAGEHFRTIGDGQGGTTVQLDSGPTAGSVAASVPLGTTVDLTAAVMQATHLGLPGDTVTISGDDATGTKGSVSLSNGDLKYTAVGAGLSHIPANGSQTDSFVYTITDENGGTSSGTVSLTVSNPADVINGPAAGFGQIQGTAGTDIINAFRLFNTIYANGGNDVVNAGQGNATVYAGAGDVVTNLNGFMNSVTGGDGNETVSGSKGLTSVTLGNGNDTVSVGGVLNAIKLGNGNDNVTAAGGGGLITLGSGQDVVKLGGVGDLVTLNGSQATVTGGQGADVVTINGGTDALTFSGAMDAATINGTATVSITDLANALRVNVGSSTQTDTISGFFSKDSRGLVDLLHGAGGYTSSSDVLNHLTSDNHGGTMLALGTTGSIDFAGTTKKQFSAFNFKIG